jgi:hypothetical protein
MHEPRIVTHGNGRSPLGCGLRLNSLRPDKKEDE